MYEYIALPGSYVVCTASVLYSYATVLTVVPLPGLRCEVHLPSLLLSLLSAHLACRRERRGFARAWTGLGGASPSRGSTSLLLTSRKSARVGRRGRPEPGERTECEMGSKQERKVTACRDCAIEWRRAQPRRRICSNEERSADERETSRMNSVSSNSPSPAHGQGMGKEPFHQSGDRSA